MSVGLSVCLSVCTQKSKPTGTPFGTKLLFGPGKVLKQQYLGKRKKCGNAAQKSSFSTVLAKYLGHFETDLDALWHKIASCSCEGSKTTMFGKTKKKYGNAARKTSFLTGFVKYLGHFETDLDAFWHEITFWSCEGCKTSIFEKTQKCDNAARKTSF